MTPTPETPQTDEGWTAMYRCSFVFPNGQRCVQLSDSHSPFVHSLPTAIDWANEPADGRRDGAKP